MGRSASSDRPGQSRRLGARLRPAWRPGVALWHRSGCAGAFLRLSVAAAGVATVTAASTQVFVALVSVVCVWWCVASWWAVRVDVASRTSTRSASGRHPATVAATRTALIVVAWLVFTYRLAAAGFLLDVEDAPPVILRVMAPAVAATLAIAWSPWATRLARNLPLGVLIGFQAFRLPLELWLHRGYVEGVVPIQMTYSGLNFDIVTGITAAGILVWSRRGPLPRWVVGLWSLLGLTLLCVIVTVAVLSVPGPLRAFAADPPNEIVLSAPFVWLPTVLVLSALLGHVIVLRAWFAGRALHSGPEVHP